MINNDEIIRLAKIRYKNDKYCDACEKSGRLFYLDKDNQVNHSYCTCFLKITKTEKYPILLNSSRIPKAAWKFNFSEYKNTGCNPAEIDNNNKSLEKIKTLSKSISEFISNGSNIFIQGQQGTGKTIIACLMARYAMLQGFQCAYVQFQSLMELFFNKNDESSDWIDYIRYCKFLVLDDVDKFKTDSNYQEVLFDRIIRPRVQNQLSNCYVSLIPFNQISSMIGFSNQGLIEEKCEVVTFVGMNSRKNNNV